MTAEPAGGTLALPETGTAPRAAGRGRRVPWISIGIIVAFVAAAVVAPLVSPADPYAQSLRNRFKPPVWEEGGTSTHPLGTDRLGRDMLARILYGARVSLAVGALAVLLASSVGAAVGLVAGYYGGWLDVVIMRVMDGLFAFPIIILAIAMMAIMGFGVTNVIIAVAVGFVAPFARVTRADVLAVKEEPYIEAARLVGVAGPAVILRHVLPNVLAPIIVQAALRVSGAIITEAGLSFLGLGPPPPTPVWGSMIAEGRNFIVMAPHISTIPGVALMLTIVGLNLLGDGLRDTLDPRLRR